MPRAGTGAVGGISASFCMNAPIRHFKVAVAGLDLLHATRLKLACSLLLAERMDVTLHPWSGQDADLLVVGGDASAAEAIREAEALGVARLTIARSVQAATAGALPHGASVRDINQQLAVLLAATGTAEDDAASLAALPVSLLQALQSPAEGGLLLLQRGAVRFAVDAATRSVALPPGLSLAELVPLLDDQAWSSTPLDAATFQHQYGYLLPRRRSFEALYFSIARHRPSLLDTPAAGTPVRLQHWPDLEHSDVPAEWLLPIAQLHARRWTSSSLAAACRLPHVTVQSIFSAAIASGLVPHQENTVPSPPRSAGLRDSRFLGWVARRFGLDLQGGRA